MSSQSMRRTLVGLARQSCADVRAWREVEAQGAAVLASMVNIVERQALFPDVLPPPPPPQSGAGGGPAAALSCFPGAWESLTAWHFAEREKQARNMRLVLQRLRDLAESLLASAESAADRFAAARPGAAADTAAECARPLDAPLSNADCVEITAHLARVHGLELGRKDELAAAGLQLDAPPGALLALAQGWQPAAQAPEHEAAAPAGAEDEEAEQGGWGDTSWAGDAGPADAAYIDSLLFRVEYGS